MKFLLGALKEVWINFYNSVIRDATSTTKGGIIVALIILTCIFIALAMKSKEKPDDNLICNWGFFWTAIVCLFIMIVYIFLINA